VRHRLSGRRQFAAVRAARLSASSGALRVHLAPNRLGQARVGFVIPKAVGGAVVRNRVRRRLRAAVEPLRERLVGLDVVVTAGAAVAGQRFAELSADLAACVDRALTQARPGRSQGGAPDAAARRLAENGSIRPGTRRGLAPTVA
jgi:ribonuclease P protein component